MVGIVVVSHSADLARAGVDLALQMVNGPAPRIEIAAGTADERLGTDAARVAQAVEAADDGEGVVVIMDLGSAILSAELALEFLPEPGIKTRLVPAAFVEGIFAAVISAAGGAQLDAVARDAEEALEAKLAQLDQAQLSHSQLPGDAVAPAISRPAIIAETTVVNPDGIHARPAALIVQTLASFDAQVTIATARSEPVSARSPTALMSLGARAGDVLRIEADGAGAATAVDRIVALIRDGFGELVRVGRPSSQDRAFDGRRPEPVEGPISHPIGVSPGRVVGPALRLPDPITEPDPTASLPEAERPAAVERLARAAADVADQLRGRVRAAGTVGELLAATAAIATDPELLADASIRVRERGLTPERAVWEAMEVAADSLREAGSRQALRVSDLYGVRNRIVALLTSRSAAGVPDPGYPFILLTVDLAPADAAELDPARCLAIVTEEGGPTSHTAIIARSLGIPAVVAARGATTIADGTVLLVDGSTGEFITEPTIDQRATATTVLRSRERLAGPGRTADGHHVALLANITAIEDVAAALECGAEGVGLYRTELCFLDRVTVPPIGDQVTAYRAVLSKFGGRRVVVRTLDAGSDKALPFLGHADEPNPALGVRGIRTAAAYPQLLHDQLKAIKEAAEAESAEVWVMAPMITTVAEVRSFSQAVREAGLPTIGIMIETPAAALQAEQVLTEVDFVSIGTNDLAQYAFAADRHSADLASLNDPWQPALLRLIEMVTSAAAASGKPVGVCGEAAAEPLLALVLAGLGISSLSMTPAALAAVGRGLASVTLEDCRLAARAACDTDSPASARRIVAEMLHVP
jgi:phosphoenolpyruvate-protein phosphotransferase/dihydroxyacetone kinase phosphotransfer subunit